MDKTKSKSKDKDRKTFCACKNSCQKGSGRKRTGCPCKDQGIFCSARCECGTNVIVCRNNEHHYQAKKAGVESDNARQRKSNTDVNLASDFVKSGIDESNGDISEEETPRRRQSSKESTTETTNDIKQDTPSDHDEYKGRIDPSQTLPRRVHQIKNGFALVIHNKNYPLRPREGSEKDLEAIKFFCKEADIELDIQENLKASEIRNYCKKLAEDESDKFRNNDGFICFILGHGEGSSICGIHDGKIHVKDIVSYFQENEDLVGKPKLFFIQACRGEGNVEDDGNTDEQKDTALCPPSSSDVLIAQSTIKGKLSFRDIRTGSWFIQTLMKQFKTHAQRLHLMDIMTIVNDDIARSELEGYRQMPIQVSTLTKYVYFNMANVA